MRDYFMMNAESEHANDSSELLESYQISHFVIHSRPFTQSHSNTSTALHKTEPSADVEATEVGSLKTHTTEEWNNIKEPFVQIYHQPRMTLDRAMEIMAERHNFHATKAMYKKRISKWNVMKSLKEQEKERLSAQAEALMRNGRTLPLRDSEGRMIRWDRVRRHDRQLQRRQNIWSAASTQVRSRPTSTGYCFKAVTDSSVPKPLVTSDGQAARHLLFDLESVLGWRQSVPSGMYAPGPMNPLLFFLDSACYQNLNIDDTLVQCLRQAGTYFRTTLALIDPISLVHELFKFRRLSIVSRHSIYRPLIVKFFLQSASELFAPHHPVVKCITAIFEDDHAEAPRLQTVVCKKMVDSYPLHGNHVWFRLQWTLCNCLVREGSLGLAKEICLDALASLSRTRSVKRYIYEGLTMLLGQLDYREGNLTVAMQRWTAILEGDTLSGSDEDSGTFRYDILCGLAYVAEELGDLDKAKQYHYSCFSHSLVDFNGDDPESLNADAYSSLDHLLNFLTRHDLGAEIKTLQEQYTDLVDNLLKSNSYPFDLRLKDFI